MPTSMPSMLREPARNRARVRLRRRDGGRVDVYLGPWGSSAARAQYERVIAAYLDAGRVWPPYTGPYAPAEADRSRCPTLGHLAALWLDHLLAESGPRSWRYTFARETVAHIARHGELLDQPPDAITPMRLDQLRAWLCAQGSMSRSTVERRTRHVVSAYKWGASQGLIEERCWLRLTTLAPLKPGRAPAPNVPPPPDPAPVRPVPESVIEATLPYLSLSVRALVDVQRWTGMRPGEAVALTWERIDRSGPVWLHQPVAHKTLWRGRVRLIAIGPQAQAVLLDQGGDYGSKSGPCIVSSHGTPYTVAGYRCLVRRACRRAAVEVWTPNQLRHTYATAVRRAMGLDAAGAALGHSRLSTTEVYAERDAALAVEAARRLG